MLINLLFLLFLFYPFSLRWSSQFGDIFVHEWDMGPNEKLPSEVGGLLHEPRPVK
jgi:hypothetical protein